MKVNLCKNLEFRGNYIELKSLLDNSDKTFYLEWISRKELKIESKWSIGTFFGILGGINGYIQIENTHIAPLKLQLKTKVRLELVFMTIISFIMLISAALGDENISIWFFIFLPCVILWTWFIYSVQEKILFAKFKKLISN